MKRPAMESPPSPYMSIKSAAAYLQVDVTMVRRMIKDGYLRAYTGLGPRIVRLRRNEIDAATVQPYTPCDKRRMRTARSCDGVHVRLKGQPETRRTP